MTLWEIDGFVVGLARLLIHVLNGNAAVGLFFVISGLVRSLSPVRTKLDLNGLAVSLLADAGWSIRGGGRPRGVD